MSDNSHRVSRRTALKGIAAVATTGAVGVGGIIHASEPAAAVEHQMEVEDIVIETPYGAVTEMGISDLWFEASWQNIPNDIRCAFSFSREGSQDRVYGDTLATVDLGESGDGTSTFGFGETYADSYEVDLATYDAFSTPIATGHQGFLAEFQLDEGEAQKTVEAVTFSITLLDLRADGGTEGLDVTEAVFDATVERTEPDADASEGDADAFGDG